jgi:hypothetical protein
MLSDRNIFFKRSTVYANTTAKSVMTAVVREKLKQNVTSATTGIFY